MLIFNDNSVPYMLDNIYAPVPTDFFWILDFSMLDFTLSPLNMLEEIVCPSMQVSIKDKTFVVPANWHILVFDKETSQMDVVELSETAGKEFTAFVYGPSKPHVDGAIITITNYFVQYTNVVPALNKHQMVCHPVSHNEWVCLAPSDTYSKYLKEIIVGDLIS